MKRMNDGARNITKNNQRRHHFNRTIFRKETKTKIQAMNIKNVKHKRRYSLLEEKLGYGGYKVHLIRMRNAKQNKTMGKSKEFIMDRCRKVFFF